MAVYYTRYSTWKGKILYLEDIVVTQSERKKGIGKRLFDQVMQTAKENNYKGMSWQVLDWNQSAIEFYQKYPTVFDEKWVNCQILF